MVEWKKLGEVAHYYRGVTYNKQQEVSLNSGGTRILRANNINIGINTLNYDDVKEISKEVKIKNYQWLYKKDILICAGSGSKEHVGKVAYIKEDLDYAYGGFMGKIVTDNSLIPRYLFHIISGLMFKKYLEVALNSTTINNLNSDIIYNFEIPVPSLSEQQRIVGILDTFTNSIENLKEQIAQRRKQYEYYRDQLLDLEGKPGVEMKTLGEVCIKTSNIRWKNISDSETFKYIDLSSVNRDTHTIDDVLEINKDNAPSRAQQIVNMGDIILGTTRPTLRRYCQIPQQYNNQICSTGFCIYRANKDIVLNRWLFHSIGNRSFWDYCELKQQGAGYPCLSNSDAFAYIIPVPSLSEQQRIVSILDTFEASVANLEQQLALREKQYEYYREKLLMFE